MNSRDFCYWLQGLFEIGGIDTLNKEQIETIKRHLNMVFLHEIDPSFGTNNKILKEMHTPKEDKNIHPRKDPRLMC